MGASEVNESSESVGPMSPDPEKEQDHSDRAGSRESTASPELGNDPDSKPAVPTQKRRRVTRACDECRRKKIKCDGKQPCTHCTVYSYECTYDQPSNRRRNPAPQYIEALEQRLQKAESILRVVLPGVDLEDPKFDAHSVDQIVEASRAKTASAPAVQAAQRAEDDAQLQTMVDQTGTLDLDDTGHWDFHGQSSGYMFMRRFRAKFGEALIPIPRAPEHRGPSGTIESPRSIQSPFGVNGMLSTDLPSREIAISYCKSALDDGCALSRPLHKPTFYRRLNALYDTDTENWNNDNMRFLPLLYIVMAVGCLFTPMLTEDSQDGRGYQNAIDQGYNFFNASKALVDVTDCRDLVSVQTVTFMILFLQGSAKLATCYSYIGIALRACCRLGMHRKVNTSFNAIEQEERKRLFWCVRKLDGYVGSLLGLPLMLSDDDIDQDLPIEVHEDYLREDGILPMPAGVFPLIKATNAHTKLMMILKKVLTYIYPLKSANPSPSGSPSESSVTIGHSSIRELEQELQVWMDQLPMELRPSEGVDTDLSRVQQLLRISYAFVQMTMYRPFLHYVSPTCQTGRTDKRSFACAAACVSVARNVVHITSEMRKRNLLGGSYWFVMYITYFAILVLVYFVLENPHSTTSAEILKDAREGRETLASLAKRSLAADRCSMSLSNLFEELPEKLKERRSSLQAPPSVSRKRAQPISDPTVFPGNLANVRSYVSNVSSYGNPNSTAQHTRSAPIDHVNKPNKKSSLPNSPSNSTSSFSVGQPVSNGNFATPVNGTPASATFDWNAPQLQQGSFPDLKTVMFPSDNPFAYGNQPISTLEDTQFGGLQDLAFEQFANGNGNKFGSTEGAPQNPQQQNLFGSNSSFNSYNSNDQIDPRKHQPQSTNFNPADIGAAYGNGNSGSMFGVTSSMVNEPDPMSSTNHNQGQEGEDYWSHFPNKGQFRTGLTPGGPHVNLDELFGGGNGWGPVNMGADINMAAGNLNQDNTNAVWARSNGNNNWQ